MKRPIESDYTSHVAYTRALEKYCDWLVQTAQEPCGWQFYQDGKWHNGMEINDHRANTEAAGVPVRDVYPTPPAQPAPEQQEQEFVDQLLINECKSVSLNYQAALYELQRKARTDFNLHYCIVQVRLLAEMLAMLVSHTETWQGKHGYPKHVLTSVEMIPDCRHYLEVGMHKTFIEHMNHCLGGPPPPSAQRQWVGLTDEEKRQIFEREDYQGWLDYINAIEAKLKEKNT